VDEEGKGDHISKATKLQQDLQYDLVIVSEYDLPVGSDCLVAGSSSTVSPKLSGFVSGAGGFMKGSTSLTAGIYSGMNGFNRLIRSTCTGLY
jgi:hypothetical protein